MFARAVEAFSAPSEAASALASVIRSQISILRPACPEIEQACLRAGERLGETLPVLSEIAGTFERLSASLGNEAFATATDDLDNLTHELARATEDIAEEGRMLQQLSERNDAIGQRIEDLLGFTRTMSWLVFTLKIESAPLNRLSADMTSFAENIHRLAETTRRALEDYHATHFRLVTLLRAARAAQARFQAEHQTRLAEVAAELRADLADATERRLAAVAGLRQTGARAREMVGGISEAVVALQIGDQTRQRIEHVHGSMERIADALEGRPPPALRDLAGPELETLAARACLLQARQIEGARNAYGGEARSVAGALDGLIEDSQSLVTQCRELFGPSGDSFLAAIEARLIAARETIANFGGARAAVDEAAHSVVAIVEDMRGSTSALTDHVVDVTIIGTNALLRSTRLGDQGKGVALIARELRAYGEQTGTIIRSLPAALDGLVEMAAGLTQGGRLEASGVAGLQARMNAVIDVFGTSRREIEDALARLVSGAEDQHERLVEASGLLRASADTESGLSAARTALETTGRDHAGPRRPDLDLKLDALLLPTYSMDCEREIHAHFAGARPRAVVHKRRPRNEAEMVDAILL